ncbi:PAS domain-containing sensor histidine kinase [Sphingomonas aliaeris]|uniref:histidine kinase n=1 Tax=Sphingomonas aliaeris TaxID=2759526 RepID=A0A974NX53_9SPHN|nr:PAS domain-containing sensor histidine kinase [Sphingomonas aliaeris]QQV78515.1 PAS domain-containing sensor histidine kinase [Sphingomonas aliaeris]
MSEVDFAAVRGLIDPDGRLREADTRLDELNVRAGGAIGQSVAVPQIASVARLAKRLGIPVTRAVIAGDADGDLELWVKADPTSDGVQLEITGWQLRTAWIPGVSAGNRDGDFVRSKADWLWETDAALRLTYVSAGAGTRHGFDPTALMGQPLTGLFALGEDGEGAFPILNGLAKRQRFEDQRAILRPTGQDVRLTATPRTDRMGGFAGFIGAVHVLASVVPSERQAEPDIVPSGGLPGSFAVRLDAALRTPLGRIIANADSINAQSEGPLRQDYVDYAADIASAGRHLMGLIDDLVDLQAIERPDFAVTTEAIDLGDVARRAAGLLAVRASASLVSIDRSETDDVAPAHGEFRRALQVLVNLIGNAVRYSPAGGIVRIHTERAGEAAMVIVADQGKGIAIQDQERIFDKFERVDPGEPGGSGLGLYIARRLARAMGGDITVDSAPGDGARFVFTLPYQG